jgi:hypothetical protein
LLGASLDWTLPVDVASALVNEQDRNSTVTKVLKRSHFLLLCGADFGVTQSIREGRLEYVSAK